MTNKFLEGMKTETNWKLTENQADALKSTFSDTLDLFGTIGALRTRSDADIELAFMKAYNEDNLLALKMLFYARNIRGGLGERRVFRVILNWLVDRNASHVLANLDNIVRFGRWDDLYEFVDTKIEKEVFEYMRLQFTTDLNNAKDEKPISLLGKWLKSANSKSAETRKLGLLTAKHFGLSEKDYRKALTTLRKALKVIEVKMSAKEWTEIDYAIVPSKAMTLYRKAFYRHDEEGFEAFINAVKKGEKTIKATTLYPYDLVEKYLYGNSSGYGWGSPSVSFDDVIEEQWKALPNYVEGENNFMVMADTSGSMTGRPMATAVGLAIYFAERNKGAYANKFMTFAEKPRYVHLKGQTLKDKLNEVPWNIVENTNIEAAFNLILKVAVDNNISQDELPKALIVISDMEFDQGTWGQSKRETYTDAMKQRYAQHGYTLPKIVYWNVDARQNTFHAKATDEGIQFISGQSVSAFKSLIRGSNFTALELMLETLNDPMYDSVVTE